jgi:hypothetical protein
MFIEDDWKIKRGPQLVPTIMLVSVIVFNWRLAPPGLPMILCQLVGILGMGVALYLLWRLGRSRYPTIEISDGAVSDGSLFRFGKQNLVPIADIAGVSLDEAHLELRTTAGSTVVFWVGGLSMATREAARVAIENAVRAQGTTRSRATPPA